ncbi:MAG TPA: exosome complex protein Rrp42 [Candidatus Thermoplasmatota archaeon]
MSDAMVSALKRDYLHEMALREQRVDGRKPDEMRKLEVIGNPIGTAEGSALVHLGGTSVIVGVKAAVGSPFADRPKDGVIITNTELVPMASPSFEPGPPSKDSIEIARVVDRSIRESKMLELGELCIKEGEKVWMLNIDIHAINYDGNLFDAALIGAVTALKLAKLPAKDKGIGPENVPLKVHHTPASTTAVKIGRNIFIDPQIDEESVAEARLTVGVDEHGALRAMQKGLAGSFTVDEVKYIIRISQQIAHKTREAIHRATG